MKPILPCYSGDRSKAFWRRVNRLPDRDKAIVYALGCALQDLEHRVLTSLTNSERKTKERAG